MDIFGYLKNTHKNPKFGKVRQDQPGNSQPSSQIGTCLTLPNLGFLWVFFKYPKISKNGNPLFFPVIVCSYSDFTQRGYQFLFLDYLISLLFVFFLLFYVLINFYKSYYIIILFYFFHENYFNFFMFRDVPECSGMFHVPAFIDARWRLHLMGSCLMTIVFQSRLTLSPQSLRALSEFFWYLAGHLATNEIATS